MGIPSLGAKQSHFKFRLKSPSLRGSKATEAISMNSRFYFGNSSLRNSRLGILEFPKIRYCKALKKEGAILFIKP